MTENIIETLKNIYGSDFTIRSRTDELVQIRKIYYKLCKDLIPGISLNRIGNSIGRDHATVLSSLSKFQHIKKSSYYMHIYTECLKILSNQNIMSDDITSSKLMNVIYRLKKENVELKTKISLLEKKSNQKLENSRYSRILKKIHRLEDKKLEELELYRIDPFIRMNLKSN